MGKVGAPKSWLHTCAQLKHWMVVMALLLGVGHKAVAWLLSLTCLFRNRALVFDRQVSSDCQWRWRCLRGSISPSTPSLRACKEVGPHFCPTWPVSYKSSTRGVLSALGYCLLCKGS